jgi:Rrf2 family iron-sulfur cluster assembly transcriptional regulator
VRGPGGGYRLGRESAALCVAEIIDAVNETVDSTRCGGLSDCQSGSTCLTHQLWCDLSDQIHHFLTGITLADLVAKREVQEVAARQNERQQRNDKYRPNLITKTAAEV